MTLRGQSPERHGLRRTPEYRAFADAKSRCRNPRISNWKDYGGRGIKFLFTNFKRFLAEVGPKPSPDHLLDRKNNEGHYEPGNVRWATPKESAANRRQSGHPHLSGERNPNAKLTQAQADEIRHLYSTGRYSYRRLANRFGVSTNPITDIVRNLSYNPTGAQPLLRTNRIAKRRGTSSKYRGVYFRKKVGNWSAHFNNTYLGVFDSEEAAAHAYDAEALKHFGPHAFVNLPIMQPAKSPTRSSSVQRVA